MVARSSIVSASRNSNYDPMSIDRVSTLEQCDSMLNDLHAKMERIHSLFTKALLHPDSQFDKMIAAGLCNMEIAMCAHEMQTLTTYIKRFRETQPSNFFSLRTKIIAITNSALQHSVHNCLVTARANENYLKQLQWYILCHNHTAENRLHLSSAYNALLQSHQAFCVEAPMLSHWHQAQREQLFLQLGA